MTNNGARVRILCITLPFEFESGPSDHKSCQSDIKQPFYIKGGDNIYLLQRVTGFYYFKKENIRSI